MSLQSLGKILNNIIDIFHHTNSEQIEIKLKQLEAAIHKQSQINAFDQQIEEYSCMLMIICLDLLFIVMALRNLWYDKLAWEFQSVLISLDAR